MTEAPYRVEPAKSDRSTCTVSKEKIDKGEMRFGALVMMGGKSSYKWRKISCITFKQASNVNDTLGGCENVDGFSELTTTQQEAVREAFASAVASTATTPKPSKSKASGAPDGTPASKKTKKGEGKEDALAVACSSGSCATVAVTLTPAVITPELQGAAHKAIDLAKAGSWKELFALLDKRRELVNVRPDVREYSTLHQAAYLGKKEVVKTLIDKYGADPTLLTKSGWSSVAVAKEQMHSEVVELLKERIERASCGPTEKAGVGMMFTPEKTLKSVKHVHQAATPSKGCVVGHVTSLPALSPDVITAAHHAIDIAKEGRWTDLFKALDVRKDVVNVRPSVRDFSVLHQAVYHNNTEVVSTLLDKYGADPALLTGSGLSLLEMAETNGCHAVLDFLTARVSTGACTEEKVATEEDGDTDLLQLPDGSWKIVSKPPVAASSSATEAVHDDDESDTELAQMPDGNWKIVPKSMKTATPVGTVGGTQAAIKPTLVETSLVKPATSGTGARIVTPTPALSEGVTAEAHRAIDLAKEGYWPELFRLLDARPELVNVRPSVREFSVLHQAVYHNNKEVVSTLLGKYGADPALLTGSGLSLLEMADTNGCHTVLDFLTARESTSACTEEKVATEEDGDTDLLQLPDGSWKIVSKPPVAASSSATEAVHDDDESDTELAQMPDGNWKIVPKSMKTATPVGTVGGTQAAIKPTLVATSLVKPETSGTSARIVTPTPALSEGVTAEAHRAIDLAKEGYWPELFRLLDARPELVNVRPSVREFSVLHQAAYHDNAKVLRTLVESCGADPSLLTGSGLSLRQLAETHKCCAVLEALESTACLKEEGDTELAEMPDGRWRILPHVVGTESSASDETTLPRHVPTGSIDQVDRAAKAEQDYRASPFWPAHEATTASHASDTLDRGAVTTAPVAQNSALASPSTALFSCGLLPPSGTFASPPPFLLGNAPKRSTVHEVGRDIEKPQVPSAAGSAHRATTDVSRASALSGLLASETTGAAAQHSTQGPANSALFSDVVGPRIGSVTGSASIPAASESGSKPKSAVGSSAVGALKVGRELAETTGAAAQHSTQGPANSALFSDVVGPRIGSVTGSASIPAASESGSKPKSAVGSSAVGALKVGREIGKPQVPSAAGSAHWATTDVSRASDPSGFLASEASVAPAQRSTQGSANSALFSDVLGPRIG
eukprot:CAMPEP_0194550552 /NCGR_PEP_ID=MMETSP0253-20130528/95766_1 /TAXON_ID=2966 /ORGANISM="Noctiluca scintillans" /LENGTH=1187 /DNA_ID=CAMNT_0039397991 /DNA_START=40 /DNA_END=3600 /DNA_ORIENTATION=+